MENGERNKRLAKFPKIVKEIFTNHYFMYDYLKANQIAGQPFVILEKPVSLYQSSFDFKKSGKAEALNLPEFFNCYLVDEGRAPYEKVTDADGKEINNLVTFACEKKNCKVNLNGTIEEATHLDYNFFNYPAPVMVEKEDGTVEEVRQKWLTPRYRANVLFPKPVTVKLWDKDAKAEKPKVVTHAKLDIPAGLYSKDVLEVMENTRETLGEDIDTEPEFPSFSVSFEYDATAAPADKYSKVKVKKLKESVDALKELEEFKTQREEFVPPARPF